MMNLGVEIMLHIDFFVQAKTTSRATSQIPGDKMPNWEPDMILEQIPL